MLGLHNAVSSSLLIHFRKNAALEAANVTLPAQWDILACGEWIRNDERATLC